MVSLFTDWNSVISVPSLRTGIQGRWGCRNSSRQRRREHVSERKHNDSRPCPRAWLCCRADHWLPAVAGCHHLTSHSSRSPPIHRSLALSATITALPPAHTHLNRNRLACSTVGCIGCSAAEHPAAAARRSTCLFIAPGAPNSRPHCRLLMPSPKTGAVTSPPPSLLSRRLAAVLILAAAAAAAADAAAAASAAAVEASAAAAAGCCSSERCEGRSTDSMMTEAYRY